MENIKIGRITLAFTFISLGIIIFLEKFISYDLKDLLFIIWPIIIIVLGIELIAGASIRKQQKSKGDLDLISIAIIIIIVVVLATMNLASKMFDSSYKYSDEISEEIVLDETKKLIIDESNIDIEITKSSDEKVRVKLQGIYEHDDEIDSTKLMTATATEEGTVVTRQSKQNTVYFMNINSSNIKYRVELPIDVDIDIISKYGDIIVSDVKSNIDINANTSDIDLRNIVGNVSILNSYGDLKGEDIVGDIDVTLKTGDVSLDLESVKNIDITSEYGDVTLKIPKQQKGKFNIITNYGDIDDEFEFDIMESASTTSINETRGVLNPILNIKVESGDVILKAN